MNLPADSTFEDPLENYDPKQYESSLERALSEEPVSRIRHRPHTSIPSSLNALEAAKRLAEEHVACVLVEDEGKLVGIFTDREILNAVADEIDLAQCSVQDVMSKDPIYVYASDPVAAALNVMAVSGYRHVPVIDVDEKIVGIISPQRVTAFLSKHFPN